MSYLSDVCACTLQAERERRQTAELAVVDVKALLKSLQEESTRAAERHTGEFNKLTTNLREALAKKQVPSTNLIMLHHTQSISPQTTLLPDA